MPPEGVLGAVPYGLFRAYDGGAVTRKQYSDFSMASSVTFLYGTAFY